MLRTFPGAHSREDIIMNASIRRASIVAGAKTVHEVTGGDFAQILSWALAYCPPGWEAVVKTPKGEVVRGADLTRCTEGKVYFVFYG